MACIYELCQANECMCIERSGSSECCMLSSIVHYVATCTKFIHDFYV